jgi:RNA polymerase sigma-70 factor, ECF subfamily
VQDAAVQAYRAFGSFSPGTNFRAWFLRIQTNLLLHSLRKKKRSPQLADLEDAPELYLYTQVHRSGLAGDAADPAHRVLGKMDTEQVNEAIAALPDEFRVAAALYFIEDLPYQEIAEILECPVGTVRSRLHRGRKLLQKALWRVAVEQGIVSELQAGAGREPALA